MLSGLFGSKTRVTLLKLFVFNPQQEYYARQIERSIESPFEPIRKELIRLEKAGLLKRRISGKQKYYSINTGHTLYPDIKSMILKTVGLGRVLQEAVKQRNDIVFAFIYGSYAKDTEHADSDIDLFVIGDISSKHLQGVVSVIENQTKREINPTVYSEKEFMEKYISKNHFIVSVLKEPKIFIKGDEGGLRKLVRGKKA